MRRAPAFALLLVLLAWCAGAEPVELRALTYNVHGLPSWIARDDPPARIPQLLALARDYDVVLLQEDFSHQDVVDAHREHPHAWRGNGAWLPLLGVGSGLTISSAHPAVGEPIATPYGVCHGWLGAANDCLAHKGFLHVRLRLPDGSELDVWNTHLDAGRSDGDRAARAAQLDRLEAAIAERSRGRPVLVGGDFNLDWDDREDRALLEGFCARLGLAVAARTPAGSWHARLDYLLVRSARATCIDALEPGEDARFVDALARPLSDHPAIRARLRLGRC